MRCSTLWPTQLRCRTENPLNTVSQHLCDFVSERWTRSRMRLPGTPGVGKVVAPAVWPALLTIPDSK